MSNKVGLKSNMVRKIPVEIEMALKLLCAANPSNPGGPQPLSAGETKRAEELLSELLTNVSLERKQKDRNKEVAQAVRERMARCFLPSGPLVGIGSSSRNTALKDSDLDFLVPLPDEVRLVNGETMSPSEFLSNFCDLVKLEFSKEGLAHDGVTRQMRSVRVVVEGHDVDLVPAFPPESGKCGYQIADLSVASWISTDPLSHKKRLGKLNKKTGLRLIPTLRLMKAWKKTKPLLLCLGSFELESLFVEKMDPSELRDKTFRHCLIAAFLLLGKHHCLFVPGVAMSLITECTEAIKVLQKGVPVELGRLFGFGPDPVPRLVRKLFEQTYSVDTPEGLLKGSLQNVARACLK